MEKKKDQGVQAELPMQTVIINKLRKMLQQESTPITISQLKKDRKWTTDEINSLKKIVGQLRPKTAAEWQQICLKMHRQNSRRRPIEYRLKFESEKAKQQKKHYLISTEIDKNIYQLFQEGNSPSSIAQSIGDILVKTVIQILIQLFNKINRVLTRAVEKDKLWQLKIKDHKIFKWIKENNMKDLEPFQKIQMDCDWFKQLQRVKSQLRKQNPKKCQKIKEEVRGRLTAFCQKMLFYSKRLQKQSLKEPSFDKERTNIKQNHKRSETQKTESIALLHLQTMSQFPYQFRPTASLFSEENLKMIDDSLQKSIMNFTSADICESQNFFEEYKQTSLYRKMSMQMMDYHQEPQESENSMGQNFNRNNQMNCIFLEENDFFDVSHY